MSPSRISSRGPPSVCTRHAALRHDQGLTERMGVPVGARAGFEGDERAANPGRSPAGERLFDAHPSGEVFRRTFAERRELLRVIFIAEIRWVCDCCATAGPTAADHRHAAGGGKIVDG